MAKSKRKFKNKPRARNRQQEKSSQQRLASERTSTEQNKMIPYFGKILTVFLGLATLVGVYIAYLELIHPRIAVDVRQAPSNLFASDFIISNNGYLFTLKDATAILKIEKVEFEGAIMQNSRFKNSLSTLGNIEPRGIATARIPALSSDILKSASICLLVNYKVSILGFDIERVQKFGFYAKRSTDMDHWISRPCTEQ